MFNYFFELKIRILYTLIFCLLLIIISFFYKESLLFFLVEPSIKFTQTVNPYFIYTNLTEVFSTYVEMSVSVSLYLTLPLVFYQLWQFFIPGLYPKEISQIKPVIFIGLINYLLISFFLYNPILSWLWFFFTGFGNGESDLLGIHLEAKLNEYLKFINHLYFYIGLLLQFFLTTIISLLFFISGNILKLINFRKYFYVGVIVLAALVTPPDVVSQLVVACPLFFFYELVLFIILIQKEYKN